MIGRLHAPHADALVGKEHGGIVELGAPQPGLFVPSVAPGDLVTPGHVIGTLVVLGRSIELRAGTARGLVTTAEQRAVGYGDRLVELDLSAQLAAGVAESAQKAAAEEGRVFRAPTSGRYYGRSTPDKPPFVTAGTELTTGATICLLEVMKTFHRVTYGGETARVREVLVVDGQDVNAGDPLLALD
jgi:acetyl-CoA carboxylase biotin carboxyl carrier protein